MTDVRKVQSEMERLDRCLPQVLMSLICTYLPMPYPEGDHYEGEYFEGKFHGKGKYVRKDGLIYEGEWKSGRPHGKGVMTYADGGQYEGEWKDGQKHGTGRRSWLDSDDMVEYDGDWKNDKMHGRGWEIYVDPFSIGEDGEFEEFQRTGIWVNGELQEYDGWGWNC